MVVAGSMAMGWYIGLYKRHCRRDHRRDCITDYMKGFYDTIYIYMG